MKSFKSSAIILAGLFTHHAAFAQFTDTTATPDTTVVKHEKKIDLLQAESKKHFPLKQLLIPGFMLAYGFTSLENDGLRHINEEFKDELYTENPHRTVSIDNYLQFAPAAIVYGLNVIGIKGRHNLRDRTMIYAMSNIFLNISVTSLKKITRLPRPDGSAESSFPSGHTAEAFASAEFMRLEYKNVSPWYGAAGYAMAAATGYLRMYNNKHWFGDVVAGAGVGILSTKIAYWIYPKIQHKLFKDKPVKTVVMPVYQNNSLGVAIVQHF